MRRLLLLIVLGALCWPAPSAAMTDDQAAWRGIVVARADCDGGPGVWLCGDIVGIPFPKSYGVARCDDTSRWCVEVLYVQYDFTWPRTQHCVTRTHWRVEGDVDMTYHSEGCFGTAAPPGRAEVNRRVRRMV